MITYGLRMAEIFRDGLEMMIGPEQPPGLAFLNAYRSSKRLRQMIGLVKNLHEAQVLACHAGRPIIKGFRKWCEAPTALLGTSSNIMLSYKQATNGE